MKRGFCNHPAKKSKIVTEWKCVDIMFPAGISTEERSKRTSECRAKDYYGVCELCTYFTSQGTQTVSTGVANPDKSTYTDPKPAPKKDSKESNESWDSLMDEII